MKGLQRWSHPRQDIWIRSRTTFLASTPALCMNTSSQPSFLVQELMLCCLCSVPRSKCRETVLIAIWSEKHLIHLQMDLSIMTTAVAWDDSVSSMVGLSQALLNIVYCKILNCHTLHTQSVRDLVFCFFAVDLLDMCMSCAFHESTYVLDLIAHENVFKHLWLCWSDMAKKHSLCFHIPQ